MSFSGSVRTPTNSKRASSNGDFTFVTVAPKGNFNDNPVIRRLKIMQDSEKKSWKGIDIEAIGKPGNGISNTKELSGFLKYYEGKCTKVLNELSKEEDTRPILLTFSPVSENQLVKEGPIPNIYSKGNFLQQRELLYRVYKTDARLVRSVLEISGLSPTDSHDWNILWLGSSGQPYLYEGLNEYQKINHFPNSYEITRKDRMHINLSAMIEKYGIEDFDFIPETYLLPDDFNSFYSQFQKDKHAKWIHKPCNSSQGKGIYLVESLSDIPADEPCVVSRYIQNPLLINQLKFDIRIYVLVTCFEPLRIYMFKEGLARFASEPYTPDSKGNKYVHLTNYSVNKKNEKFIQNQDWKQDDYGHKWSVSALCKHLEAAGVDIDLLWSKIYDLIIKTIMSIETTVVDSVKQLAVHRNNCFDLLGFDILIDSELKPWLLEVNLSPSLATDSPLDLFIKGNLVADTLNLVGLRMFDRKKESANKIRSRIRARQNQLAQSRNKNNIRASSPVSRKKEFSMSQSFKNILKETLEEYERRGNFVRIYPSKGCSVYDHYFTTLRPVNRTLYNYLFEELLSQKSDDQLPPPEIKRPTSSSMMSPIKSHFKSAHKPRSANISVDHSLMPESSFEEEETKSKEQLKVLSSNSDLKANPLPSKKEGRLIITGDDILIEYVSRIMHAIKAINEENLKPYWKKNIDNFISHQVWHSEPKKSENMWERLEERLQVMKTRKKQINNNVEDLESQKHSVLRGLSASQIEKMLLSSSKNAAHEIVSCLFDQEGKGVLTGIIKWLATSAANPQARYFKEKRNRKFDDTDQQTAEESTPQKSSRMSPTSSSSILNSFSSRSRKT
ncbi:TTLL5_3 [Blepharisma stoltei]|uniref:Tubulin--tyrosine ligase-like protein 5 n=1 Tax=Blepharisma stoltei TaxID=1481888 RepID=A0AAU9J1L8_9CILI|nr:unnamed protein product [Blepharisma stoltei]